MINDNSQVVFADTVFAQEIEGEMVLLDMNTESYFGLDSVASDIWKLLREGKTLRETYEELLEMYDVEPETLRNDLETFTKTLVDNKLAALA